MERQFEKLHDAYQAGLHFILDFLPAIGIFTVIVFISIYFLYAHSKSELAPQEIKALFSLN